VTPEQMILYELARLGRPAVAGELAALIARSPSTVRRVLASLRGRGEVEATRKGRGWEYRLPRVPEPAAQPEPEPDRDRDRILKALGAAGPPVGAQELARATGLPRSRLRGLLEGMASRGEVRRQQSSRASWRYSSAV